MEKFKRLLIALPLMACLCIAPTTNVEAHTEGFNDEGEIFYVKNKNVPRTAWIDCTEDDMYWLYQCVEAEEGSLDYRAKYLAACCIVNRWREGWKPSIKEVIFARNQFEVVTNGKISMVTPSEETIAACNSALDEPETWVVFFSQGNLHKRWGVVVEVVDGEYFYRSK